MFSLREKLLVLPWQQRKYENHLRKVQSAQPAIDNRQPLSRAHVAVKLKRKQKEEDRISKIERENLILLRRLGYIMKTNTVDNRWDASLPNLLHRPRIHGSAVNMEPRSAEAKSEGTLRLRESKCLACNPRELPEVAVPEERVPWEPAALPVGRVRSKSVPIREKPKLPIVPARPKTKSATPKLAAELPQRILLSRGSLMLSVNFPSDTSVKFQQGSVERTVARGCCYCKNSPYAAKVF